MTDVYSVLDVSSWEPADEEPLGSKPKLWLRNPSTDQRWLWKETTWNVGADGQRYRKGDDWAERVAREVGTALGVPTAEVELAVRGERFGVASRTFVATGEILVHGNELLEEVTQVGADPRDRTNYNLANVEAALRGSAPLVADGELSSAFDWFAGYLVLDALIGNTDRHQENWGVIESAGSRRLAPSFDHASCLGFLLRDDEREERLLTSDEPRTAEAFARRAQSRFEGERHPVEVAAEMLAMVSPAARARWRAALEALQDIEPVLARVPEVRMSEVSRRFARAMFAANHRSLSHRVRTMGP